MRPVIVRASPLAGWALLLAWAASAAVALALLGTRASASPVVLDAATERAAAAWVGSLTDARRGRATVVRLPAPAACACGRVDAWPALRTRWGRAGATVVEAATAPAALRAYELLLVDPAGRLAYAGPLDGGPMCGARHPVDALLAAGPAAPGTPALSLLPACDCHAP